MATKKRSANFHEHLALSLAQERERIVQQLWQIRQDLDSYNENQHPADPIRFVFDFRADVEELEAARLERRGDR